MNFKTTLILIILLSIITPVSIFLVQKDPQQEIERKRTFLNNFVESYVMDKDVISSLPYVRLLDKPIGKGFKRQFAKRNKAGILNIEKLMRSGMFGYNDFKDRKEGRKSNTSTKTVEL